MDLDSRDLQAELEFELEVFEPIVFEFVALLSRQQQEHDAIVEGMRLEE